MTLNEFLVYCQEKNACFTLYFSESEYNFDIWVHQMSEDDDYMEKNVSLNDLSGFCERFEENTQQNKRTSKK